MSNDLQNKATNEVAVKLPFSSWMAKMGNKLVENTLKDEKRRTQFIANIVSAVSTNDALKECDQASVVSAALQAEALHFPINSSLGYAYLVPYGDKNKGKVAQFQMGYKGYLQLAIRSGQYKDINVVEIKEGELSEYDPLNGVTFNFIKDYEKRKAAKTIGYAGQIELINGFKKQIYISYEEMLEHADKYSKAFDRKIYEKMQNGEEVKDAWKYSSFWYKSFDDMAKKTVLRQMLSKWGIMSVEMEKAYVMDDTTSEDGGKTYDYIDNPSTASKEVKKEQEEKTATKKVPDDALDVNDNGEVDFSKFTPEE